VVGPHDALPEINGLYTYAFSGLFVAQNQFVTQNEKVHIRAPFCWADKPAEKHCWLICCERKILFRLKKQAEKNGL
jgi:hypothetical protein